MGHKPRAKPKHLAAKLLAIRQGLKLSQSQILKLLNFDSTAARISEYESGARIPSLPLLLAYARLIGVAVDVLIDDDLNLPETIRLQRRRKTADVRHTEVI